MIEPSHKAVDRERSSACFHGGAFFDAIGDAFDDLHRRSHIINADVLDAWFPPSPNVLAALREHLPWLLSTSPPTNCSGMVRVIAKYRGVPEPCILPGAGSSALIFLATQHWLQPSSRVLLLDPTYGEYQHVLQHVVGCHIERLHLSRANGYRMDLEQLLVVARRNFDLIVLVNPNSPTGAHVDRDDLIATIRAIDSSTRIWVDETYVDYIGASASLESFAAATGNVVVCKSMSKVYALSGVRAAYLCAGEHLLQSLRKFVPPWAVSLPAQVAAVEALQDPDYYLQRYRETHALRDQLQLDLRAIPGVEVSEARANFLLCNLEENGPTAAACVAACRERGVFLRDVRAMGTRLGSHAVRIAVKDAAANRRIVAVVREVLS